MVKAIPEGQLKVATDLNSCGPALMTEMMAQITSARVHHGRIGPGHRFQRHAPNLIGTALTLEKGSSVPELKEKVATKGEVTEQGLKVLERDLLGVFNRLMRKTLAKHTEEKKRLAGQLGDWPPICYSSYA